MDLLCVRNSNIYRFLLRSLKIESLDHLNRHHHVTSFFLFFSCFVLMYVITLQIFN